MFPITVQVKQRTDEILSQSYEGATYKWEWPEVPVLARLIEVKSMVTPANNMPPDSGILDIVGIIIYLQTGEIAAVSLWLLREDRP